ncbi:MAG: hypothetical protein ACI83P_002284, partial [Janthinobacterium sp.]
QRHRTAMKRHGQKTVAPTSFINFVRPFAHTLVD